MSSEYEVRQFDRLKGIYINFEARAIEFEDRHGTVGRIVFTDARVLVEGRPLLLAPTSEAGDDPAAGPAAPPAPRHTDRRERQPTVTLAGTLLTQPVAGRRDRRGRPTAWAHFAAQEAGQEATHRYGVRFHGPTVAIALGLAKGSAITVAGYPHQAEPCATRLGLMRSSGSWASRASRRACAGDRGTNDQAGGNARRWSTIPMQERRGPGDPLPPSAILRRVEAAVAAIQDSATVPRWRAVSACFPRSSLGNQVLSAAQRPDTTQVAGCAAWRGLGRQVRRGEWGIAILVRHRCTVTTEAAEEEPRVTGFGTGYVFDLTQTDGEPLPRVEVPTLAGDAGGELWDGLARVAAGAGVRVLTVPREELPRETMGAYRPARREIVVGQSSRRQMTKTLAHELGHHVARVDDRAENACLAEGIADVVCAHVGVDTGEQSFPYVATWARDNDVMKTVLGTMQTASATLIEGVRAASGRASAGGEVSDAWQV